MSGPHRSTVGTSIRFQLDVTRRASYNQLFDTTMYNEFISGTSEFHLQLSNVNLIFQISGTNEFHVVFD
ncbi:hypothetical protein EG68_09309 [Paragonimus skrjabini miyazakii]|uniref:Uncharacterized protein n=1 Tax=Paragonimus skrjabini miyazakii TaxID=59628 RepID=A0A8S9YI67_9TREM|nr:hypothetical protein EG68_09309 [Paragonimus skrjabini miyazakii]